MPGLLECRHQPWFLAILPTITLPSVGGSLGACSDGSSFAIGSHHVLEFCVWVVRLHGIAEVFQLDSFTCLLDLVVFFLLQFGSLISLE